MKMFRIVNAVILGTIAAVGTLLALSGGLSWLGTSLILEELIATGAVMPELYPMVAMATDVPAGITVTGLLGVFAALLIAAVEDAVSAFLRS